MSGTRNVLRNRNSKKTFAVNSPTSLSKLNVFSKSANTVDYSKYDPIIEKAISKLPENTSSQKRLTFAKNLRQAIGQRREQIDEILNHHKEFATIIHDWQQSKSKNDPASLTAFLKLLGKSIIGAKLNALVPGLTITLTTLVPTAAYDYAYHSGQPKNGIDMCEHLANCIQGYLTEIGGEWRESLPQISRVITQNTTANWQDCLIEDHLGPMLIDAYRGTNEFSTNCTFLNTPNIGGQIQFNATNIDPIACDDLKNSAGNFLENCATPTPTQPPSADNAKIFLISTLGGIGGICVLAAIALAANNYLEYRRAERKEAMRNIWKP